MTPVPWPQNNHLIQKVESWGKQGLRAIKCGCIKFLNRKGEKIDWDNNNLSGLEVRDEQPRLTDPGVADIPVEEMYDDKDNPEKPSYVTRAVAARKNAGLNREQEPHTARWAEEHTNDKTDKAEDDQINCDFEPVTAQGDLEETTTRKS